MRQPQYRHGRDRDRAAIALTAPPHLNLPADCFRPKTVGRCRARGFSVALDGWFSTEARRLPMLAVEMEITAEFYSKQVTFVSTNDIIW